MIAFRLAQVWALCKLAVAFVVALFYKHKPIWLVAERGVDARDNGYWFFRYLKEKHPDIESYYIISKDSPDREKMLQWEDSLLEFKSFKHYVMLWRASYLISSHLQGYFPFRGLGVWVKSVFPYYRHKIHVNIKHGITMNYAPTLDYNFAKWDLIIAGARPEYDFFVNKYEYPSDYVALTGLARFDGLNDAVTKRQLLLMPTWREWIFKDRGFEETEYAQQYAHLLQSPQLHNVLENEDVTLVFYPHHEMQKYIDYFKKLNLSERIVIADSMHYDVQQLLKESSLLITDYSSVIFDFAYMRKPILCYQFDYEQFRTEHYQEGWFSYQNSFVDVFTKEYDLIDGLKRYILNQFNLKDKHSKYIESLFPYSDSNNCERVYQAIINTKNRKHPK
jgi:CDP-glycerol glycerophosphotransferase (TagB/SpsB family)